MARLNCVSPGSLAYTLPMTDRTVSLERRLQGTASYLLGHLCPPYEVASEPPIGVFAVLSDSCTSVHWATMIQISVFCKKHTWALKVASTMWHFSLPHRLPALNPSMAGWWEYIMDLLLCPPPNSACYDSMSWAMERTVTSQKLAMLKWGLSTGCVGQQILRLIAPVQSRTYFFKVLLENKRSDHGYPHTTLAVEQWHRVLYYSKSLKYFPALIESLQSSSRLFTVVVWIWNVCRRLVCWGPVAGLWAFDGSYELWPGQWVHTQKES